MHIVTDAQWNAIQEKIRRYEAMLFEANDDDAPQPMIDESIPIADDSWDK